MMAHLLLFLLFWQMWPSPGPGRAAVGGGGGGVSETDNFNRADGALGSGWSSSLIQVVDNHARIVNGGTGGTEVTYRSTTYADNQSAEIKIITDDWFKGPVVRWSTSTFTGYFMLCNTGTCILRRYNGNTSTFTDLATPTITGAIGDVYKMTVSGSATVTLTMYQNGSPISGGSVTDSSGSRITSGRPGFGIVSPGTDNPSVDDFASAEI